MFEKKAEALKILEELDLPSQFGYDIENEDDSNLWEIFYGCGVEYFHGCTKAVFTKEDWDFVVKIGFNGQWSCECEYDDETYECTYGESEWIPFGGRDNHQYDGDSEYYYSYMDEEFDTIMEVMDTDAYKMVLETEFLTRINGLNVYIQEKAVTSLCYDFNDSNMPSGDSCDYVDSHKNNMPSKNWSALVIDCYGIEAFNAANELDKELRIFNDMHYGNYGYRNNGSPVILDFGGFIDQ